MTKNTFTLKQMGGDIEKSILYNRAVLYVIFFLTLGYLFILTIQTDYYTFVIFILIGFLTSFFSKNMIVILSLAMSVSFIFKYGTKVRPEGFQEGVEEVEDEDEEEEEKEKIKKPTKKPKTKQSKQSKSTDDILSSMTPTKANELVDKYKKMIDDGKITIEIPLDNNIGTDLLKA